MLRLDGRVGGSAGALRTPSSPRASPTAGSPACTPRAPREAVPHGPRGRPAPPNPPRPRS
ncbi:hypothetical protein ACFQ3Z_39835 [Streptomyces nogalater]